jgi:NADH:ubiquinone oxidoreductase subunit F (NADH-binding)/NADH:ubiquinone oxidoreductase subunit E
MIVQRLHEIQERDRFLSRDSMVELAQELGVRLRHLHEVASFFPHFRLSEPPAAEVLVCRDMACHLKGAAALEEELGRRLSSTARGRVHVGGVSCLGQCDRAPAIRVNDRDCSLRDPAEIARLVAGLKGGTLGPRDIPANGPSSDPGDWAIDPYKGNPTYGVLRSFAAEFQAEAVLKALEHSGLVGLGGPGQRTGKKWAEVREAPGETKYVVCNGDESEPGTFKDRELLVHAPHLIIEGMAFGAAVVGATQGYVYIRHEFEGPIAAMKAAILDAYKQGVLGRPSPITGRRFDLEVFVSPGGYICGEQTALIEAIEGHRGEPRNRPPELQVKGLRGMPTLLNNIETFAWVPSILADDGAAFLRDGANGGRGRRFFSISGDVGRPGVYEVPIGTTLGDLIGRAGGLPRGLKAVATSGPSGGFLPRKLPISKLKDGFRAELAKRKRSLAGKVAEDALELDVLDLELDVQVFRILDAPPSRVLDSPQGGVSMMLGAGIVVYGEGRDMVDQAVNCGRFFRAESCGKCVPCREGTQRIVEISERLDRHRGDAEALATEGEMAGELRSAMVQASICGLGQVASNPLLTAINLFPADFANPPTPEEPRADG